MINPKPGDATIRVRADDDGDRSGRVDVTPEHAVEAAHALLAAAEIARGEK